MNAEIGRWVRSAISWSGFYLSEKYQLMLTSTSAWRSCALMDMSSGVCVLRWDEQ